MFPIPCEFLYDGLLVVLGIRKESSSVVVEGVGGYPIQLLVGNRIPDLLDVVE